MLKKLQERIFPFIIALSALSVSASAAFYSVTGLSKLFAGASTEVLIMAGSLEVAKLVIASLLYQYWDTINKGLRTYLSVACFILILITSAGIYGFLSSAYQETAALVGNIDTQVALVETKRDNIKEQLAVYNEEKSSINEAVTSLRDGLSNNVIQYKDPETGEIITTTSSSTRRALEKQLDQAIERQTEINIKVDELNGQLFTYETEIVEIQTGNDVASELGPLKYLAGLTGLSMDKIINYLLLIIIFVFDPLAISLVVAANFAFAQLNKGKIENYSFNTKLTDIFLKIESLSCEAYENEITKKDAFKHILTSAYLTTQLGKNIANGLGGIREFYGAVESKLKGGEFDSGWSMDMANNKIGLELGKTYPNLLLEEFVPLVKEIIETGNFYLEDGKTLFKDQVISTNKPLEVYGETKDNPPPPSKPLPPTPQKKKRRWRMNPQT